jgi:hypothetical protein
MKRETLSRLLASALILAVGMIIGTTFQSSNQALGEVRTGPPPAAFQSGGQMSVPILKEIASTLHQMDARLAKLELAAQKLQSQKKN